jgi:DNA-binding transcriptional LysR family regulator/predicted RNA-binding Zn ribbon-like protein
MADTMSDEGFLLGVLNSTPVVDGVPADDFADAARARAWLAGAGGLGTEAELRHVLEVRQLLQAVVRGEQPADVLAPALEGVARLPAIGDGGITWTVSAPPERELAVRAVLAWDTLARNNPGRLRSCANDECRLFLVDHSKAGTARWCSMAACGNRMKARRHYQRARGSRREGLPMISLRGLECLVAITEHGSLTKAAAVLHTSQPALSHQVAAIERELGTAVIERLPRGIRPTAAGLAAVAEARVALAAVDKAVAAGRRVAAGKGGRIRIACAETMTGWLLVPVLRSWRLAFPDVELDVKEYTSADRMLDVLLAGGADITVAPPPTKTDEHVEVLGEEEIVVVAAPEHRFAAMDRVPLAELSGEPLVHYNPDNGNAVWVDQFAARRGVVLPPPTLRTGSPRTAAQLAAAGMGVAIVPFSALTPRPAGTIRSFDPPETRSVIVIVAAPHDDLARRFVRDLKRRGLPTARVPGLVPSLQPTGSPGAMALG